MGLHLATLVTGAAVGTLVIYVTKDEDARKTMERFIDGTGEAFMAFLRRITPEKTGDIHKESGAEIAVAEKKPSEESTAPPLKEQTADGEKAVH